MRTAARAWSRPAPAGAGQPMVEIDPVGGHAELGQEASLSGEILFVGGAPRISSASSLCLTASGAQVAWVALAASVETPADQPRSRKSGVSALGRFVGLIFDLIETESARTCLMPS